VADVLTPPQRRLNMSRIRGRDTKPEMQLRQALHARGLRYRLNVRALPGCPDLVFPHFHAVIRVHGCFWHGHDCPMFKAPTTRPAFWAAKISGNRARDQRTLDQLLRNNWRVLTVWECALRGRARQPCADIVDLCQSFLCSAQETLEVKGLWKQSIRPGALSISHISGRASSRV
jgi:DNA mismatch endonuclease (patch repair protein)